MSNLAENFIVNPAIFCRKIAVINQKDVTEEDLLRKLTEISADSDHVEEKEKTFTTKLLELLSVIKILFSTRKMSLLTTCLMFSFLAVGMGSYGIHFAVRFSNMSIFLTNAIQASATIVFILIFMFLLNYVSIEIG